MTNNELMNVLGGASISSSMLSTIIRFASFSLELGRTLGTLIRRSLEKNKC